MQTQRAFPLLGAGVSGACRFPPAHTRQCPVSRGGGHVCTSLLTVYWPQTALFQRGSLLPWQREGSEEGTAPDTSGSGARLGLLTAIPLPCRPREELKTNSVRGLY